MEQQLAKEISLIKREPRVIIQDNLKKRPQGKFRDLEGSPSHYRLRGLAGNEKKFGESGLGCQCIVPPQDITPHNLTAWLQL